VHGFVEIGNPYILDLGELVLLLIQSFESRTVLEVPSFIQPFTIALSCNSLMGGVSSGSVGHCGMVEVYVFLVGKRVARV
jgi:hypothetical protein